MWSADILYQRVKGGLTVSTDYYAMPLQYCIDTYMQCYVPLAESIISH